MMRRVPPRRNALQEDSESEEEGAGSSASTALPPKKKLGLFTFGRENDAHAVADHEDDNADDTPLAVDDAATVAGAPLRRGGAMRGFVPAGFDRERAFAERQAQAESRRAELERALDENVEETGGDGDADELDAYMRTMRREATTQEPATTAGGAMKVASRLDLDAEDDAEAKREQRAVEEILRRNAAAAADAAQATGGDSARTKQDVSANALGAYDADPDPEELYDDDDEDRFDARAARAAARNKDIEPLPFVDHSQQEYVPIASVHYEEHHDVARRSDEETRALRQRLGVHCSGLDVPRPVTSFAHLGLDDSVLRVLSRQSMVEPTAVQAQTIPSAMLGRDVLAVAQTGQGKTLAFVLPAVLHAAWQPALSKGDGPLVVILAPTHELVHQIHAELRPFAKALSLTVADLVGGVDKHEQFKVLRSAQHPPHIVVATPGRLIDLVRMRATNFTRTSMLVLDEADRMFEMGFERQVRSVCEAIRPDRQTMLFSATFRRKVERLAGEVLTDPVRIRVGSAGDATALGSAASLLNPGIQHYFSVVQTAADKWAWIRENVGKMLAYYGGKTFLVFVGKREAAVELATNLARLTGVQCLALHGELPQHERHAVIQQFKKPADPSSSRILVATDIASRGLDLPHLQLVINYDLPRDMETYIHRVGRTGRPGQQLQDGGHGVAHTLVTRVGDEWFAGKVVGLLKATPGCARWISDELATLARSNRGFYASSKRPPAAVPAATFAAPPSKRSRWDAHP